MRYSGLAALDMDGVLVPDPSTWERFHQILGTEEERERNMELFYRGEIDYETWARLDAYLWRQMSVKPVLGYLSRVPLVEGARQLVDEMHRLGVATAIVSTGIEMVAEEISRRLGMDFFVANRVIVRGGAFTGEVLVRCPFDGKGLALRRLGEDLKIPRGRWAAVGNDSNDVSMFKEAAFSVAFNPISEDAEKAASVSIRSETLHEVTDLLRQFFLGPG